MELTKELEKVKKRWIKEVEDSIYYREKSYKNRYEGVKGSTRGKQLLEEIKDYKNRLLILKN